MDISPVQLLSNRLEKVYGNVSCTVKEAFAYVNYGKTAAFPSVISDSAREESRKTLNGIYENIVELVNTHYNTGDRLDCAPVVEGKRSDISRDSVFPLVSKKPAREAVGLRGIIKSLDVFIERFGGFTPKAEENVEELTRVYPFSSLLHRRYMAEGESFKKLSRNVFVNDRTKTTLIFLGGAEKYRQIDMLFSASVGAIQDLPGVARCIAFYPDIMCAEYDFIGIGLRELLLEGRDGLAKAKLQCLGGNNSGAFGVLKERLQQLMPFIVLEMCGVVKNLNVLGLCLTKASPNNFALDSNGKLRPVLVNLDCLKPEGCDFSGYNLPRNMMGACAPEMAAVDVTVTEEMSSYIIGKVIRETLDLALGASSSTDTSPSKALKISPEVWGVIDIITDVSPGNRCRVDVLIKAVQNIVERVASSE